MSRSESAISKACQLEASRRGHRLWRNNVGALLDKRGVPVRYGLANESKEQNKVLKSSDLIGLTRDGQFIAAECKKEDWRPGERPDDEAAQQAFHNLVRSLGGLAGFVYSVTDGEPVMLWEMVGKELVLSGVIE